MPPNGNKHSEACRQLGTYVEQLGTYDEQLGTWKIPSAELFLRSGEQSRAMRARKYRTPSVYRKFAGGLEATPSQSGNFRSARCQTCCQANLKRRCTGRAWLQARRCQANLKRRCTGRAWQRPAVVKPVVQRASTTKRSRAGFQPALERWDNHSARLHPI